VERSYVSGASSFAQYERFDPVILSDAVEKDFSVFEICMWVKVTVIIHGVHFDRIVI
jgi:hypothetical protein